MIPQIHQIHVLEFKHIATHSDLKYNDDISCWMEDMISHKCTPKTELLLLVCSSRARF